MSGIVDANGKQVRPPKRRGSDLATLNEVINVASNMTGPLAVVVREIMEKLARVEDKLGITDETAAAETEAPKGTPYRCIAPQQPQNQQEEPRVAEPTLPGGDVE